MKETKIEIPAGCEVDKIETQDGHIVVTFREKEKERKLPKSWEEFCEMFPIKKGECYIYEDGSISDRLEGDCRGLIADKSTLPNRATAEAVLALCQLIQLRNAYNGDWVPNWTTCKEDKFVIDMCAGEIEAGAYNLAMALLYFKTEELSDEFLRYFRDLIEKLKPLYGIKEGGKK